MAKERKKKKMTKKKNKQIQNWNSRIRKKIGG